MKRSASEPGLREKTGCKQTTVKRSEKFSLNFWHFSISVVCNPGGGVYYLIRGYWGCAFLFFINFVFVLLFVF